MSTTPEKNNSWYFILALIFGVLTAWVFAKSVLWAILGGIIGLIVAALYINFLVEKREG